LHFKVSGEKTKVKCKIPMYKASEQMNAPRLKDHDFPNSNTVSRSSARFFRLYAVGCSMCRYSAM